MSAVPRWPHRGTLQPGRPVGKQGATTRLEYLQCQVCSGWFDPEGGHFGCPYCAEAEEMLRLIPGPL